ncbi:MAG: copper resistance protein NlpE [Methyloprofundus sp.]|nr:copper resistance protein NlpE [Methyloprofundus sp.]
MKKLKIMTKQTLSLALLVVFGMAANPVLAKSDKQTMGDVQKARMKLRGDHATHLKQLPEDEQFKGVYFGYLPCDHCAGIKLTLSLKNKHNYLLVTQYAQASNKEFYEKGKYTWNKSKQLVTLVSRKDKKTSYYRIKDGGDSLIQLAPDGSKMKGKQSQYELESSETMNSREVHIH